MSLCRWSSDDWRCDIYCYGDSSGGVTIHVAARKHVGDIPRVDWSQPTEEVYRQYLAQMEWIKTHGLVPIGLSRDGESYFNVPDDEAADLLQSLRDEGYRMPDGIIEELRGDPQP